MRLFLSLYIIDELLNYCYFLGSHPPIAYAYNLAKGKGKADQEKQMIYKNPKDNSTSKPFKFSQPRWFKFTLSENGDSLVEYLAIRRGV